MLSWGRKEEEKRKEEERKERTDNLYTIGTTPVHVARQRPTEAALAADANVTGLSCHNMFLPRQRL